MDQKTDKLTILAERHAQLPDNYDVAEHARDDVPALCEAIRAQDAEIARLKATFDDLLRDWQGLVDTSCTIGEGAREGVQMCIKMLKKARAKVDTTATSTVDK